jgi:dUTP pyrophosphatase
MKVFKFSPNAEIPAFATEGSAAFDLKACLDAGTKLRAFNPHNREMEIPVKPAADGRLAVTLHPQFRTLVPTGLIFDIPEKHVLKLFIRSSMALKYSLALANGTGIIDSDYVDPTYMMVINTGDTPILIYHGDRIAQGLLEKTYKYTLEETTEKPSKKTDRDGGLGSTGT